jgi:hypothetical protein
MKDKTFLLTCKIIGIIYAIFGIASGILIILGIGTVGLISKAGIPSAELGVLLLGIIARIPSAELGVLLLGIIELVVTLCCSYGLLKTKSWAYKALFVLAIFHLLRLVLIPTPTVIVMGMAGIIGVIVDFYFAYMTYTHRRLFKK